MFNHKIGLIFFALLALIGCANDVVTEEEAAEVCVQEENDYIPLEIYLAHPEGGYTITDEDSGRTVAEFLYEDCIQGALGFYGEPVCEHHLPGQGYLISPKPVDGHNSQMFILQHCEAVVIVISYNPEEDGM